MCGRFTLRTPAADWLPLFQIDQHAELPPRFNIAPTQMVSSIKVPKHNEKRELVELRWGLIPFWSKDKSIGSRLINARAETVADKPAFRSAFRFRRCLVIADGFFEWKKLDKKTKQPYYICMKDRQPFAMAGLWERWKKEENPIQSCTIITTQANEAVQPLHDRMPVILASRDFDLWLDPAFRKIDTLRQKLIPFEDDNLEIFPVNSIVNNALNDEPVCVEPIELAD